MDLVKTTIRQRSFATFFSSLYRTRRISKSYKIQTDIYIPTFFFFHTGRSFMTESAISTNHDGIIIINEWFRRRLSIKHIHPTAEHIKTTVVSSTIIYHRTVVSRTDCQTRKSSTIPRIINGRINNIIYFINDVRNEKILWKPRPVFERTFY